MKKQRKHEYEIQGDLWHPLEQALVETHVISNQFFEVDQAVIRLGHLLCVPSEKLGFKITVLD